MAVSLGRPCGRALDRSLTSAERHLNALVGALSSGQEADRTGARVDYAVLGDLQVLRDGVPVDLGSPLQRALLGLLATERGRTVSTDRIVEELWGQPGPGRASSVQTYVSRLRRVLGGEAVVRVGPGYRLVAGERDVDAARFEELAAAAHRHAAAGDPAAAVAAAEQALALWRADLPLADLADREFARRYAAPLVERRLGCQEVRLGGLVALGRYAEAVADLEAVTAAHPLRERPWEQLLTALHRAGRTADALDRYQRVRRLLADELGLEPGAGLKAAHAAILRDDARPAAPPPLPPAPPHPAPLPSAPPPPAPPRAQPTGRVPLVGRDRETALLRAAVAGLPRTGPRFLLLDGEAGIGKTRLADELSLAAGVRTVWGRCHEDDDAPQLWPWRQVLAGLPGEAPATPPGADALFAFFEHVLDRLVTAAGREPLLVVLDDLHWSDGPSLRLLAFLAAELREGPVAILATVRADARGDALLAARAALARAPGYLRVEVRPLDAGGTAELVRAVLAEQGADADGALLAQVGSRSGGNPFFATELARLLADDPARTDALPSAVRDVVHRRVGQLPGEALPALRLAAVAGDPVDPALLLRTGVLPADPLLRALDSAADAGLLVATGTGALSFAHDLVRQTVLAGTGELTRRGLHATLAGALDPGADPYARAHHLIQGRPLTPAADALDAAERAAERAGAGHAHDDAARWWERAVALLGEEPGLDPTGGRRARALLRCGTALGAAGGQRRAQERLAEAIDVALAAGDLGTAAAAAAALGGTGGTWFWVEYGAYPEHLLAPLRRLLAALGDADSPERVRVLGALGTGSHYGPDPDAGDRLTGAAVAAARRLGDPVLLAGALAERLRALWQPGRDTEQVTVAGELLALAERHDLPLHRLAAHTGRAPARLVLGDLTGSDADVRAAWELAERLRLPLTQGQLVQLQCARALLAGELDTAAELGERAAVVVARTEAPTQEITALLQLTFLRWEQGRLGELLAEVTRPGRPPSYGEEILLALVLAEADQPDAARAVLAERDGYRAMPRWWNAVSVTCVQAHLAAELGDVAAAGALADRLAPHSGEIAVYGGIGALGPVDRFLGRAEAAAGRTAAAERHLRQAAELAARWDLLPALAHATLHLAELLVAEGRPAEEPARTAAEIATAVGMEGVRRRAETLLARLG